MQSLCATRLCGACRTLEYWRRKATRPFVALMEEHVARTVAYAVAVRERVPADAAAAVDALAKNADEWRRRLNQRHAGERGDEWHGVFMEHTLAAKDAVDGLFMYQDGQTLGEDTARRLFNQGVSTLESNRKRVAAFFRGFAPYASRAAEVDRLWGEHLRCTIGHLKTLAGADLCAFEADVDACQRLGATLGATLDGVGRDDAPDTTGSGGSTATTTTSTTPRPSSTWRQVLPGAIDSVAPLLPSAVPGAVPGAVKGVLPLLPNF
jgi:hypothetical protein